MATPTSTADTLPGLARSANSTAALASPSRTPALDPSAAGRHWAEKIDGGYRLNGSKMWISNAYDRRRLRRVGEVARRWRQDRGGSSSKKARAVSPRRRSRASSSLRASVTGEIVLDNVEVPKPCAPAERLWLERPLRLPEPRALRRIWGAMGRRASRLTRAPSLALTARSAANRSVRPNSSRRRSPMMTRLKSPSRTQVRRRGRAADG